MTIMTELVETVKEELTVKSLKDRLSSKTISDIWKTTRDVSLIAYIIAGALVSPACPLILGVTAVKILGYVMYASGILAGVSQLDKSKKIKK